MITKCKFEVYDFEGKLRDVEVIPNISLQDIFTEIPKKFNRCYKKDTIKVFFDVLNLARYRDMFPGENLEKFHAMFYLNDVGVIKFEMIKD